MDNELADRIRAIIGDDPNVGEIRMMGGLCFTLNGNMLVGVMKSGHLLARVGEDRNETALAMPGASPMAMGGRTMKGFVNVSADVLEGEALREWIAVCTAFVGPMPAKQKKKAARKR